MDAKGARPDWLTRLLIWVAIILVAVVAAVATDFWIWPAHDLGAAQAIGQIERVFIPALTPRLAQPRTALTISTHTPPDPPAVSAAVHSPTALLECVPPLEWGIHIVQEGNTLYSIAQRYDTDVDSLMRVNCLNTSTIFAGQRLYVPGVLPLAASLPPTATAAAKALSASSVKSTAGGSVEDEKPAAGLTMRGSAVQAGTTEPLTPRPAIMSTVIPTASPRTEASRGESPTPSATTELRVAETFLSRSSTLATPLTKEYPAAELTPTPLPTATPSPLPTATPKTAFQVNIPNRYLNIVLLGSDKRPNSSAWRTDSMIVVSVDVETNVVRLLSIPRDLWVYIPRYGYNRINTAELWGELAKKGGGTERVKQTIHYNLGIPIHYYVRVDFQGFIKIIDTVGGIDVDVDCPLPDIKLESGVHHMDGKQALRYSRSRKSTSDFDRGRRQRKVLMALWDQALTMNIIPKLPELWMTMADTFQTDLPLDQVINLAYIGVQLKPQHILSRAIDGRHVRGWMTPQGAAVLLPREDKIRTMLENYYTPKDPNGLGVGGEARVEVLNGAQRRDADQLAAAALRWEGFQVVSTHQADRQDYAQSRILVWGGELDRGQQIARLLKVSPTLVQNLTHAQDAPDRPTGADIQVILGRDYNPCQR